MRLALVSLLAASALSAGCGAGRASWWGRAPEKDAAAADTSAAQPLIAEGDEAWKNRGDKASLEKALDAWARATQAAPAEVTLYAKLSRGWFFLADAHLRKGGEKSAAYLEAFEKGTGYGELGMAVSSAEFKKAVTSGTDVQHAAKHIDRNGLESMYWAAANLGKWARAKGLAARLGNKDKIKGMMQRCLDIDENFFHAAPHRFFGAYHVVAPDGSIDKSKEHFEKSLQLAPNYAGTKVLYAENYAVKKDDRALFDRLISEVLATPDDILPDLVPETRNEKEKAQDLKARAGELF